MNEVIINTFLDFSCFDGAMTPLDKVNATRYPLAQKLYLLLLINTFFSSFKETTLEIVSRDFMQSSDILLSSYLLVCLLSYLLFCFLERWQEI